MDLARGRLAVFIFAAEPALFSNRQRDAEHAIGHSGSSGIWRNIDSNGAHVRWARVSAEARVQVSAAVHGHTTAAYRAAKKAAADQKCGRAGRGDRQIVNVDF